MSGSKSSMNGFLVNSSLRKFARLCGQASEEQVDAIVRRVGERSAARAPRGETGELKSSMKTETDTREGNIQGRVLFGSRQGMEYVVVQHEHTDFQHPSGGEAKFLERTVNEMTPELQAELAKALRDRTMGGA